MLWATSPANYVPATAPFLKVVQVAVAGVTLFYAIFRAGPEFDRVKEHLVARTKKGLHTAVDYHMVARRLSGNGMWASAVLHWQRATAIEPYNIVYQRQLAKAYLHLGFLERGLDILEYAQELPMQPSTQLEIKKLLTWTRNRIDSGQNAGAKHG